MILTSEVITSNLDILEEAIRKYPILLEYLKMDRSNNNTYKELKSECDWYGLTEYADFIDYKIKSISNDQKVIYENKILLSELRKTLSKNAIDDDAKKFLDKITKRTFSNFINSKKWDVYCANISNYRRRKKRFYNNMHNTSPIIANYLIQNKIDINDKYVPRINNYYLNKLTTPDKIIENEIDLTKNLIESIINNVSKNYDIKKINYSYLFKTLESSLSNNVLSSINIGEQIKYVNESSNAPNLELNKIYTIVDKKMVGGRLKVSVKNDMDYISLYNAGIFETITDLRNKSLNEILNN